MTARGSAPTPPPAVCVYCMCVCVRSCVHACVCDLKYKLCVHATSVCVCGCVQLNPLRPDLTAALRQRHACSNSNPSTAKPMAHFGPHIRNTHIWKHSPPRHQAHCYFTLSLSSFRSKLKRFLFSA